MSPESSGSWEPASLNGGSEEQTAPSVCCHAGFQAEGSVRILVLPYFPTLLEAAPHAPWCLPPPQCIPYAVLLEQLQLKNVRQLEDLVIEAVYADVLRGSLDQRNQRLEVDYSIGRDIRREELSTITRTLQEW